MAKKMLVIYSSINSEKIKRFVSLLIGVAIGIVIYVLKAKWSVLPIEGNILFCIVLVGLCYTGWILSFCKNKSADEKQGKAYSQPF